MIRPRPLFCGTLVTCVCASLAVALEVPAVVPDRPVVGSAALERITPAVQALIDRNEIAGAIALVAHRGKTVYFEAVGRMDIASDRPMRPDTIVRIYSMTKPVTSVAVMQLCEQGLCRLEDPVARYIPEFEALRVFVKNDAAGLKTEPLRRAPTIKDLLLHTAGFTYGFFNDSPIDRMYLSTGVFDEDSDLESMMTRLARVPLLVQPGTRWNYSVSTDVLGRVVEVVSGMPLDRYFAQHIFEPLDMHDTGFHVPADKIGRFATNYGVAEDGGETLPVVDGATGSRYARPARWFSGGGGLVSTAPDYLRFCQMLLDQGQLDGRRILRPETVASMTRNHLAPDLLPIGIGGDVWEGQGFGLGFGVRVQESPTSAGRVGEYGWSGAASTHFWISPRDRLIVIALSQSMPYASRLVDAVKPLVYEALGE